MNKENTLMEILKEAEQFGFSKCERHEVAVRYRNSEKKLYVSTVLKI
jgi:hypothetical protein